MKLRLAFTSAALLLSTFTGAAQEKVQYSIDPSMSRLAINVYKAGVFKAFGHDHLIVARDVSGSVQFDAPKIENSSVRLKVATKSLTVVDPGESEKDRSEVQSTMTGEKVLDVAKFAEIAFSSTTVSPVRKTAEGLELTVSGKLDLHGIEKPISFPVSVQVKGNQLAAQGELSLLQTEYGITPVNVAGGSVKVKDKLKIEFTVVAVRGNP